MIHSLIDDEFGLAFAFTIISGYAVIYKLI